MSIVPKALPFGLWVAVGLGALTGAWSSPGALEASASTTTPGSDWTVYGADLSNTRSNAGGPTPQAVGQLHVAWQFSASTRRFTGTPIVAGGIVFAGNGGGTIFALAEASGKLLWHRSVNGAVNSSAAVANGLVYFAVSKVGAPYVVAFNATTGTTVWQTALTTQQGSDTYASPQVINGDIVVGTSASFDETKSSTPTARGSVVRLNGTTGAVEWRTMTVAPGATGGGVWCTAAFDL
ncbi:MAG: hypothetical protein E6J45_11455, partial [Chloroflexi bacterium]